MSRQQEFLEEFQDPSVWTVAENSPITPGVTDISWSPDNILLAQVENGEYVDDRILVFHAFVGAARDIYPAQSLEERDPDSRKLKDNAKGLRALCSNTKTAGNGLQGDWDEPRQLGAFLVPFTTSVIDLRSPRPDSKITKARGKARHAGLMLRSIILGHENAILHSDQRFEGHEVGFIDIAPTKRAGTQPGDFWVAVRGASRQPLQLVATKNTF